MRGRGGEGQQVGGLQGGGGGREWVEASRGKGRGACKEEGEDSNHLL